MGLSGFHAECYDGVGLACELEAFLDDALKFHNVGDEMVARGHHDIGLGVLGLDAPTDVAHAGGRVPAARLQQDVALGNVRKLAADQA